MKYYSTKNRELREPLSRAVLEGLAPDGGLYLPERIPHLSESDWGTLRGCSFVEVAQRIGALFFDEDIDRSELRLIFERAFSFPVPLKELRQDLFSLELFHGPTMAFKDFGARLLAGILGYLVRLDNAPLTILVATSGDTGGAVAHAFLGIKNIDVTILYPSGKVSPFQENQLTTLGGNITAVEVEGTFDDCQRLVKSAFSDRAVTESRRMTSANSINIIRFLGQVFYYAYAWASMPRADEAVIFSVPSGNFGNIGAGLFAKCMGMPNAYFIAATNRNDVVPHYLRTGNFTPRSSVLTMSNAMDVGNPSNFVRILDLFGSDYQTVCRSMLGVGYSDEQTQETMQWCRKEFGYIADPHGAVALRALLDKEVMTQLPVASQKIFLETAHPVKFREVIEPCLNEEIELPSGYAEFLRRRKVAVKLGADYGPFKDWLLRTKRPSWVEPG